MADHPEPAVGKRDATVSVAVALAILACGLLLWEALVKPPPVAVADRSTRAASPPQPPRPRPRPPRPERTAPGRDRSPAPVVAPVPPPPPPPPPAPPAPPVVDRVDPATLRLTDIVIDPDDPAARFAVIGGVAVRAGEAIGGHPVREVLPDRVVLGEEDAPVLLPLTEDD